MRTAFRRIGARLVFLPKYPPPDLNPIEQVFAKLNSFVRKQAPRTFDPVSTAIADGCKPSPLVNAQTTSPTQDMRQAKSRTL